VSHRQVDVAGGEFGLDEVRPELEEGRFAPAAGVLPVGQWPEQVRGAGDDDGGPRRPARAE
jgi:hypothetical protein